MKVQLIIWYLLYIFSFFRYAHLAEVKFQEKNPIMNFQNLKLKKLNVKKENLKWNMHLQQKNEEIFLVILLFLEMELLYKVMNKLG